MWAAKPKDVEGFRAKVVVGERIEEDAVVVGRDY